MRKSRFPTGILKRSVKGLYQRVYPKCAEQLVHLNPDLVTVGVQAGGGKSGGVCPVPDLRYFPLLGLSRARVVIEGWAIREQ